MKIAFLHYHLKPGGVTTVLKQQLAAVAKKCETLIFTGTPVETPFPTDVVHIPELAYSSEHTRIFKPDNVAATIVKALRNKFNGLCDVLHVHNPTLAKNRQFLDIIKSLQRRDVDLLLQIHDFAEDGRPFNYFQDEYPADCHYGVINQRDYEILLDAGLSKDGLHLLANPVLPRLERPQPDQVNSMVLYPIRAIRRKNIGEAILMSLFFRHGQKLAITLPPNSPADIRSYEGWKAFVKEQKLNLQFERGLTHDFETLMLSAEFMITTSITEGFGFSFLEPWLFGKCLWGRKLPDICRDFEMNGIQLEHLYSGLYVPVDWIGRRRFHHKWTACVLNAYGLFSYSKSKALISKAFDKMTKDGIIDFGVLDEPSQMKVILRLIAGRKDFKKLIQINPFLADPGMVADRIQLIEINKSQIQEHYNPESYRHKILDLYDTVRTTSVKQRIDKITLAASFLNLENFSLLKWSDYDQ